MNPRLASALKDIALRTNARVGGAKWYLFGSARDNRADAADIDIFVVCGSDDVADKIRASVNLDQLGRPIHLSIFTEAEAAEVNFVKNQDCLRVV